jgi:hypothetical protein
MVRGLKLYVSEAEKTATERRTRLLWEAGDEPVLLEMGCLDDEALSELATLHLNHFIRCCA